MAIDWRLLCAALSLTIGLGFCAHAAPVQTPPAIQAFKVGALDVAIVRDGAISEPNNAKVFGLDVGSSAVAKLLTDAGLPDNAVPMSTDVVLIRTAGHIVLLDSGFGPAVGGVIVQSLALAGVAPQDVTDIFITHSHRDHTGGLVAADGKPAFVHATVRMSKREWAFAQAHAATKAQLAPIADKVKTFEPGREVLPGITPIAIYGHTPGHTGYRIHSHGQTLFDIGDSVHSSIVSLAEPDWAEGYDNDKIAGAKARRAELKRVAASHALVFVPHFPFPGVGQIEPAGRGYRWRPWTDFGA